MWKLVNNAKFYFRFGDKTLKNAPQKDQKDILSSSLNSS
jgi:hypothetical protein